MEFFLDEHIDEYQKTLLTSLTRHLKSATDRVLVTTLFNEFIAEHTTKHWGSMAGLPSLIKEFAAHGLIVLDYDIRYMMLNSTGLIWFNCYETKEPTGEYQKIPLEDCNKLIDPNGFGYYGTDTEVSNVAFLELCERTDMVLYRKHFTHVYWYNESSDDIWL